MAVITQYAFTKHAKMHLDAIFEVEKTYDKRKRQLRDFLKTEELLVSTGNPDFERQAAILHQRLDYKKPDGTFDNNKISVMELQEYGDENPQEITALTMFKERAASYLVRKENETGVSTCTVQ
jgi:hypothetical protein